MDSLKVNVDSFNEETYSLVCSFSTIVNGVEYNTPQYSFDTHRYNSKTLDGIIQSIASTGKAYLEAMIKKDAFVNNTSLIDQLKQLNNTTHEFDPDYIDPPAPVQSTQPDTTPMDEYEVEL